ncbi:hypothetical protein D9619_004790 [Psilocybe cf. subviscida]|uniref:Nephrocystin 3-like N-terminal domain-containing protein n=1 Tax=Psilocybe cf. subviscida TaxID=2480587 RepID=A0A8H5BSA3_9AGAR|nr:hypothetical protein D9619_004790 [Psilocybe cf. subviscida]
MSFLEAASTVLITGGQFNSFAINNHPCLGHSDPFSSLVAHSAPAGLLDARERFDDPKCDENTRQAVLHELRQWVKSGEKTSPLPSMYWIHGPAGVGKSALAQSLALSLQKEGYHAASFFFSRNSPGRNNGGQLIATLACQLAINIPAIRQSMFAQIESNRLIFRLCNNNQMESLIINPLNSMGPDKACRPQSKVKQRMRQLLRKLGSSDQQPSPRLILVDGLDECDDSVAQRDLILCLGRAARQVRMPLRIIIVSRATSHILSTFSMDELFRGPEAVKILQRDLGEDAEANENIKTYLLKQFAEIRRTHPIRDHLPTGWPKPMDIQQLVHKSSKGFIYPATVMRYIRMPNNRPDECLERILGVSDIPPTHKPYKPLDDLYHYIFGVLPEESKQSVMDIFRLLLIPRTADDGIGPITTPLFIEHILDLKPGHVQHVLRDLLCILAILDKTTPIRILHASLSDFLLDASRSRELHVDIRGAREMLARGYIRLFQTAQGQVRHGLCGFLIHLKSAKLSMALYSDLRSFCLGNAYHWAYERHIAPAHSGQKLSVFIDSVLSFTAFLSLIHSKNFPQELLSLHTTSVISYISKRFPAASVVNILIDEYSAPIVSSSLWS